MSYIDNTYSSTGYYNTRKTMGEEKAKETPEKEKTDTEDTSKEPSAASSQLTKDILTLLEAIPAAQQGHLSFYDIQKLADKLEEEFDDQVLADLKKLGVDTDKKFQLMYDSKTGEVVCSNDHPDKEKIENYFKANEDRKEQFKSLVGMRSLSQTAQQNLSPSQFKQQMQLQSMAFWSSQNLGGIGAGDFLGGQGIIFGAQNAYYKAISIKV